ncbi:glycosyltransferase family 4 protein [Lysobacter sp. KIS68-7]|uniref:glycosyltransferase family 4 protein n=1 Tax=Lysobacter sp. KIS68-7 TaxID=2904252 RepID=UPI001E4B3408|nr:glycosyltransferase family 4 protein [Lysobacter sp. KIS68-7]UHQ19924.1 glycosyltransferase family 4 protein [Lysobacter sp. KIS68-7]
MRTLLLTRNFPPLRGGMERLNARMFLHLHAHDATSALVGPAGCAAFVPDGTRLAELPAGSLPMTVLASVARGVAMARSVRPDIVLAGSGLTAPAAVAAARASGAVPAVYLHGLDIVAPSRVYRAAWWPCIRRCRRVIVNSANTRRLAIGAGVDPGRIRIVHPGTDLPVPDPSARQRFRARMKFDAAAPILLSVGRLTTRKGLAEFVEHGFPKVLARHPDTRLVIIGDQAADALHRGTGAGFERVRAIAESRGIAHAVHWLGPCSEQELADAYQGADVHVFPVRDLPGDVEGFGMVAIEAAAHGLPTVAFDVGGVADAVVDGSNGRLIPADDHDAFARAVVELLGQEKADQSSRARSFAQRFSWERFGSEITDALESAK